MTTSLVIKIVHYKQEVSRTLHGTNRLDIWVFSDGHKKFFLRYLQPCTKVFSCCSFLISVTFALDQVCISALSWRCFSVSIKILWSSCGDT